MSGYALVLKGEIVAVVEQEGDFDESLHGASFTSSPENIPDPDEYIYYDTVINDPESKIKVGEIFTNELYESKYPPTKEELISRASSKIHNKSIELIDADFDFLDKTYQADENSRSNILQKLVELLLDSEISEVQWITKDNTFSTLSRDGFIELGKALSERTESIILERRDKKNTLSEMSHEELINYEVDYGSNI